MEILEHLIGYNRGEVCVERVIERFELTPVDHVAGIRSFLFSVAKESGLVEASCCLVERRKDEHFKTELLKDISIITCSLKQKEQLPSTIVTHQNIQVLATCRAGLYSVVA